MRKKNSGVWVICLICSLGLVGALLTGCGSKEEKTSAPGYYEGPMAKKGPPKAPAGGGGAGSP